ncbi:signaling threshold-regulating transmembrane adapter 1-like [Scleropages formosus]|uniref:signaling threshold-regulating transmembrane adapter 1-like n=1 Tax=Scleropages formosus TaxID=113540 RepID=UPI0008783F76|nr:signaling threshold-regulating transmembrane adapter 1 [Scleropages formosus]
MEDNCSCTHMIGIAGVCGSPGLWLILAVVSTALLLCGGWHLMSFIAGRCTDGGKKFLPRFRRSLSQRLKDMEENPIYGNITYTQSRTDAPPSASGAADQQFPKNQAQSRQQDCYANLKLKAPKPSSARSSPKIQYSDVVTLPRTVEGTGPGEGPSADSDAVSLRSDLYASVDPERNKTIGNDKDYANHV